MDQPTPWNPEIGDRQRVAWHAIRDHLDQNDRATRRELVDVAMAHSDLLEKSCFNLIANLRKHGLIKGVSGGRNPVYTLTSPVDKPVDNHPIDCPPTIPPTIPPHRVPDDCVPSPLPPGDGHSPTVPQDTVNDPGDGHQPRAKTSWTALPTRDLMNGA